MRFACVCLVTVAGLAGGALIGGVMPAKDGAEQWMAVLACALLGTLLGFGAPYLVFMVRDHRCLHLGPDELQPGEWVLLVVPQAVHHRGGRSRMPVGQAGGRLFVTNRRLVFRTHWGQPWNYLLSVPIADIEEARPTSAALVKDGVFLAMTEERAELFGVGVFQPAKLICAVIGALVDAANGGSRDRDRDLYSPRAAALLGHARAISHARGNDGMLGPVDLLAVFLLEPEYRPAGMPQLPAAQIFQAIAEHAAPLPREKSAGGDRLPSVDEKLVIHQALDARRTPGPLQPEHLWAAVLRFQSKPVRRILRALDLDREQLLDAALKN